MARCVTKIFAGDSLMNNIYQKPSEKKIYFWNIAGSICNAFSSILLLMLVTRILGTKEGDIFSIAWAIGQLMLTIGTFQVRLYQATDIIEMYQFRQYLLFRLITIILMVISTMAYTFIKGYGLYKSLIIMILCLFKVIDALSDVYQGWFQQKERLDLAGKTLAYRVFLSTVIFGIVLWNTDDLLLGCGSMVLVSCICFFVFDLRYVKVMRTYREDYIEIKNIKWVLSLGVTCMPLFLNSFLVMSTFNAPKMAIDTMTSSGGANSGMQTIYGILFMPAAVMNLTYIVFRPLITQMAVRWTNQNYKSFFELIRKISLLLLGVGVVIMVCGSFIGIPILSMLYGIDLREYRSALLILLMGGAVNTFANVLDNALTVIRKQYTLIISYTITWIFAILVAPSFVKHIGIIGAAYSFLLSMIVLFISTLILFCVNIKKAMKENCRDR